MSGGQNKVSRSENRCFRWSRFARRTDIIQSKLNQRGERILTQKPITLVDLGRALQPSTSRITVHDLVPYFQDGCSRDEIIRWIPSLTHDEIAIVEGYYLQHKTELDEYASRIRAYRAEQIRLQRLRFPERNGNRDERLSELRRLLPLRQRGDQR